MDAPAAHRGLAAQLAPVPSVARAPPPTLPSKFSGEIDRVRKGRRPAMLERSGLGSEFVLIWTGTSLCSGTAMTSIDAIDFSKSSEPPAQCQQCTLAEFRHKWHAISECCAHKCAIGRCHKRRMLEISLATEIDFA